MSRDLYVAEPTSQHAALSAVRCEFEQALVTDIQQEVKVAESAIGEPGSDPAMFTPEPRTIKDIFSLPADIKNAWIWAVKAELKNLIENGTFILENPGPDDQVIPTQVVFKAKIAANGSLDKLKCRMVVRGDMMKNKDYGDTWTPTALLRLL